MMDATTVYCLCCGADRGSAPLLCAMCATAGCDGSGAVRLCDDARHGITDDQIRALRTEAGQAGDAEQVAICTRALDGAETARAECARVIETETARRG